MQSIPFLDPNRERLLEYDLTRAIARAETPEKPTIGLMSPLPVFGMPSNPMMQQMGQQGQPALDHRQRAEERLQRQARRHGRG